MPNYIKYQQSIAQEFKALENRVRHLIDNANWAEEGRYKEVIIINYLKRILPQSASVGTGFVRSANGISTQIDIIIYDNSYPCFFKEGDFVVVAPVCVLAIIEVKTKIASSKLGTCIEKANANGKMIMSEENIQRPRKLFNGIFSFNIDNQIELYEQHIESIRPYTPSDESAVVNHISLGEKNFVRYWDSNSGFDQSCYNFYDFSTRQVKDLSFAYFFSNILLSIYDAGIHGGRLVPDEMRSFLFPIPTGKESYKRRSICMRIN